MSTTEEIYQELLTEHVDEDVVVDTDPCFIINTLTKEIVSTGIKREIAQYDHNSERITFECERFIEGHDVLLCNSISVHYAVPGGGSGIYVVLDVAALAEDPSTVRFTWLVSSNVTQYAGPISFNVSLECVQEDGTITYLWSTKPNTELECVEVIRNSETVAAAVVDAFEQMRAQLFEVNDDEVTNIVEASQEQQEAITTKGTEVLESIPNEYTELSEKVVDNTARIADVASACEICCEASGEVFELSDAGNCAVKGLVVYGKTLQESIPSSSNPVDFSSVGDSGTFTIHTRGRNLIDASKISTHTAGGVTLTNNGNGSFTVSGSGTTTASFGVAYTYSSEEMQGITTGTYTLSSGVCTVPYIGVQLVSPSGTSSDMLASTEASATSTFELSQSDLESGYRLKFIVYADAGAIIVEGTLYPMCYKGTESVSFESFLESTATVEDFLPLRGVPVDSGGVYTDSNGQQWLCDYADLTNKEYVQYCVVFDNFIKNTNYNFGRSKCVYCHKQRICKHHQR